ncbi:MAG: ExbD/TolR family protein [Pirellulaceae bacterium]
MPEEPTLDDDPRLPAKDPSAIERRRFKGSLKDAGTAASAIIDGAELGTAYRHVEEIGADVEFRSSRKFDREANEIDMTPMVDTTFLLLLFFMVTAAFSLQRSMQVPTPRPEPPSTNVVLRDPSEDPDLVTVHVDENNTYRVVSSALDVEAPSAHELLIQLREAREGNRTGIRPTKLLVMANVEALHERVVAAMDAGSQVGMEEVQLMMVEENE